VKKKVSIIWLSGQHARCKMINRCSPGVEHHQRHSARLHLTVTVLGAVVALQRSFAFQFRRVKPEKKKFLIFKKKIGISSISSFNKKKFQTKKGPYTDAGCKQRGGTHAWSNSR
jgi:hypothetical protein